MVTQECFTEALLEGAREVFETMMFMTIEESTDDDQQIEGVALLGSITFKGNLEGCLAFCCDVDCAATIAKNMLGMEPDEELSEEETQDAIGEVCNMVMGSMKSRILESVGDIQVSIPSVVSGTKLLNSLGEKAEEISIMVHIDEAIAKLSLLYREIENSD